MPRFSWDCGNERDAWFLTTTGQLAKAVCMKPHLQLVGARVVESLPAAEYHGLSVPQEFGLFVLKVGQNPFATDIRAKMVCLKKESAWITPTRFKMPSPPFVPFGHPLPSTASWRDASLGLLRLWATNRGSSRITAPPD
ncbi:uncharacterized protein LOC126574005 [Anopheles aquasalis]|uniref:uncharacterized protein LOC126574005 n=1 Tax=Anopheles aquasalis TaxID=42839 RepID=UPI00215B6A29|nr:uncharacterized protein LOC126574005 [Anopheles aquasalis]